jgi:hypothetical protein
MTAVKTTDARAALLAEHTAAVIARENAKTAGVRAGATRKLDLIELELSIAGVEFTPWEHPTPASTRKPAFSDADLLERIADIVKVRDDSATAPRVKKTASALVDKLTAQGVARGIIDAPEEEETPAPAKTTRKGKTAADKLADVERAVAAKVAA